MTKTRWWQLTIRAKKGRITITGEKARASIRVLLTNGGGGHRSIMMANRSWCF